jgi:hypothetical protein
VTVDANGDILAGGAAFLTTGTPQHHLFVARWLW